MANKKIKKTMDSYQSFQTFLLETNKQALESIWIVVVCMELFYFAYGLYIIATLRTAPALDLSYHRIQPYVIGVTVILYFGIKKYYMRFPRLMGTMAVTFVLAMRFYVYINDYNDLAALGIWIVLMLVLAWYYLEQTSLLVASFTCLVTILLGILLTELTIAVIASYFWVIAVVIVVANAANYFRISQQKAEYTYRKNIQISHKRSLDRLNFDDLTALPTRYAYEIYIESLKLNQSFNGAYLVIMDMDDVKLCNNLYGKEIGDHYIITFANIIRLLCDEADYIAKIDGNEFVAILYSYKDEETIKARLDRYNGMLQEEFKHRLLDNRFVPSFSYGIAYLRDMNDYLDAYHRADVLMGEHKALNKKHIRESNFYKPYINYTSLFNAGNIVALVWLGTSPRPVVYITENVENMLGYKDEAFINGEIQYADLIHPDDVDTVYNDFNEFISKKFDHYEQIYRLRNKEGSYVWVRDYSVPVYENGKVTQINGYIYDITKEINQKSIMVEQTERMHDIIVATNVGTWEWYVEGDLITFNERFVYMLGRTYEEFKALSMEHWESLIHEEEREEFSKKLRAHIEGNVPYFTMEYRVKHKDGSWVWIYDRGRIIKRKPSGEALVMVGSHSDVTDLKRTESMLYHSEKLNALGRLAGGIAHDINNQMMMISSMIDLVREKNTLQAYKEAMNQIEEISNRSTNIARQLLSFSKHHLFKPEVLEINQLLRDLEQMMIHTFRKEIQIYMSIPTKPIYVQGDPSLLENAFLNLCLNAKEAMDFGGKLMIKLETYSTRYNLTTMTGDLVAGTYAKISFKDTGCGIEDNTLEMIFEPFYTTKDTGSGIGLSSVTGAVAEHKGGIDVHSIIDKGTTFNVYLPISKEKKMNTVVKEPVVETENI